MLVVVDEAFDFALTAAGEASPPEVADAAAAAAATTGKDEDEGGNIAEELQGSWIGWFMYYYCYYWVCLMASFLQVKCSLVWPGLAGQSGRKVGQHAKEEASRWRPQ